MFQVSEASHSTALTASRHCRTCHLLVKAASSNAVYSKHSNDSNIDLSNSNILLTVVLQNINHAQ